jgi:hypothetical protein
MWLSECDLIFMARLLPALLLPQWGLGVRVVRILLVGLVMPDDASRRGAELAVPGHVAGNA